MGQPPWTQCRLELSGPGFHTKQGPGGAKPAPRAGTPRLLIRTTASDFPAPNPNKHEKGCGRPASRPFVPAPHRQLPPGSLPAFVSPSPPQLPGRPAAFQGFRLGHLDAQRGAVPLIWGRRRINPRVCEGCGPGGKSKRGLQGTPYAGCAGMHVRGM